MLDAAIYNVLSDGNQMNMNDNNTTTPSSALLAEAVVDGVYPWIRYI